MDWIDDDDTHDGSDGGSREGGHGPHHHHHEHREGLCCSHDHQDEIQVYQMSTEAKLEACDAFRKQGRMFSRETQWRRAKARYQKILIYLDYTFPSTPQEEQRATQLKKTALLNCAVCAMKMEEYREAISLSGQVIREWSQVENSASSTAKAWFLRGRAYRLLGEFDKAREDLNKSLQIDPSNKEIEREILINASDERCNRIWTEALAKDMFTSNKSTGAPERSETQKVPSLIYND